MGKFHDLSGVHRDKIIPDDHAVELQFHHISQIILIIVDHVAPCPQSPLPNAGGRSVEKVRDLILPPEIISEDGVLRILEFDDVVIVKIQHTIQNTGIVKTLNDDISALNGDRIRLRLRQRAGGTGADMRIIFLGADVDPPICINIFPRGHAYRIFSGQIQQNLRQFFNRALLQITSVIAVNNGRLFHTDSLPVEFFSIAVISHWFSKVHRQLFLCLLVVKKTPKPMAWGFFLMVTCHDDAGF